MSKMRSVFLALAVAGLASYVAAQVPPHWTYDGAAGWGDLATEYASCAAGRMQSPVDLAAAAAVGAVQFTAGYRPVELTVFNNGHTIQFNTKDAGALTEAGVRYDLLQVHFHSPSEHVVKGEHKPLEAHMVHRSADGALSVLGVFIVEGAENSTLAALLRHLPEHEGEPTDIAGEMIDPSGLLPADMAVYRYAGSLTTPPCSEGVAWHVLAHPVTASMAQIQRLTSVMGMNARPVQPLNGRLLVAPSE